MWTAEDECDTVQLVAMLVARLGGGLFQPIELRLFLFAAAKNGEVAQFNQPFSTVQDQYVFAGKQSKGEAWKQKCKKDHHRSIADITLQILLPSRQQHHDEHDNQDNAPEPGCSTQDQPVGAVFDHFHMLSPSKKGLLRYFNHAGFVRIYVDDPKFFAAIHHRVRARQDLFFSTVSEVDWILITLQQ